MTYREAKNAWEHGYWSGLLRSCLGNISEAARISGKGRREIYRRLELRGIDPQWYRPMDSFAYRRAVSERARVVAKREDG